MQRDRRVAPRHQETVVTWCRNTSTAQHRNQGAGNKVSRHYVHADEMPVGGCDAIHIRYRRGHHCAKLPRPT
jgi:hypothetical protein